MARVRAARIASPVAVHGRIELLRARTQFGGHKAADDDPVVSGQHEQAIGRRAVLLEERLEMGRRAHQALGDPFREIRGASRSAFLESPANNFLARPRRTNASLRSHAGLPF